MSPENYLIKKINYQGWNICVKYLVPSSQDYPINIVEKETIVEIKNQNYRSSGHVVNLEKEIIIGTVCSIFTSIYNRLKHVHLGTGSFVHRLKYMYIYKQTANSATYLTTE